MAIIHGKQGFIGANIQKWWGRVVTLLASPIVVESKSCIYTEVEIVSEIHTTVNLRSHI